MLSGTQLWNVKQGGMSKLNLKKGGCERWKILSLSWNIRNILERVRKWDRRGGLQSPPPPSFWPKPKYYWHFKTVSWFWFDYYLTLSVDIQFLINQQILAIESMRPCCKWSMKNSYSKTWKNASYLCKTILWQWPIV